jgi:hypothetical protein
MLAKGRGWIVRPILCEASPFRKNHCGPRLYRSGGRPFLKHIQPSQKLLRISRKAAQLEHVTSPWSRQASVGKITYKLNERGEQEVYNDSDYDPKNVDLPARTVGAQ